MTAPLERRLARLSPEQRAFVSARLAAARATSPEPEPPLPEVLPLTDAQLGVVLTQRLAGDAPWFTVGDVLELRGPLNAVALEHALSALVVRHDALRMFIVEGDRPGQAIDPAATLKLERHHATDHAEALAAARALVGRAVPLSPAPLCRAALWRVEPEARTRRSDPSPGAPALPGPGLEAPGPADLHLLALVFHHAVIDGASLAILGEELGLLYRAAIRGEAAALPPAGPGFARWVMSRQAPAHRRAEALAADEWRRVLAAAPYEPLPSARPRSDPPSLATAALPLPRISAQHVREVARAAGTTPFVVLASALADTLARFAGRSQVRVATVSANRSPAHLRTVGLFCNTVVLPLPRAPAPGRLDLGAAHGLVTAALARQAVLYETLVLETQAEAPELLEPNAFLLLDGAGPAPLDLGPVRAAWLASPGGPGPSAADLTLDLSFEDAEEARGEVRFRSEVFEPETVLALVADWVAVLGALA